MAINEVRGANDFKLIHAQGKTCVENPVIDELFDVPFDNTIKIRRIVEMRMWEEIETKVGDEYRYSYQRIWSTKLVNSSHYNNQQYQNPTVFPFES